MSRIFFWKTNLWLIRNIWQEKINGVKSLICSLPDPSKSKPMCSDFTRAGLCCCCWIFSFHHFSWISLHTWTSRYTDILTSNPIYWQILGLDKITKIYDWTPENTIFQVAKLSMTIHAPETSNERFENPASRSWSFYSLEVFASWIQLNFMYYIAYIMPSPVSIQLFHSLIG